MGIRGRLEVEVEIKSSGDLFHELWSTRPHHACNIVPHIFQACELHQGDYGNHGSVLNWHYLVDGKKYTAKELVEKDEANKIVKFKVVEGEVMEFYKSLVGICQVISKGESETTTVKWALEFEKINDDGPYPTKEMDFLVAAIKGIDAHHLKLN